MAFAYIVDNNVTINGYNRVGGAGITSVNYPIANHSRLYNKRKSLVLQATAKTGLSITFDFGSAIDIDVVAILGHNYTSTGVFTLQADDDPAFGSPGINEILTYHEDQVIRLFQITQKYRYWRVLGSDPDNYAYPWIGEIVIGKLIYLTFSPGWGVTEDFDHKNIVHETEYGVRWTYYLGTLRSLSAIPFGNRPEVEIQEIISLAKKTKGSIIPVLIVFDTTEFANRTIYGKLEDDLGRKFSFYELNDLNGFAITEEPSCGLIRI